MPQPAARNTAEASGETPAYVVPQPCTRATTPVVATAQVSAAEGRAYPAQGRRWYGAAMSDTRRLWQVSCLRILWLAAISRYRFAALP